MRLSWIEPFGLHADVAHATAVFGREVAADVVAGDFIVVGAAKEPDAAGEVRARVGDDAVVGDADALVVIVRVGRRQVRRADADRAVRAAVVLDDVVGDLQVVRVRVGEDRAALRDQAAGQSGGAAADGVDVAGEARLVAAAQVEAVDGRRRSRAVRTRREGLAARCGGSAGRRRNIDRDHRAVVDGRVAAPGRNRVAGRIDRRLQADPRVPVCRHRAVAGEGAAVDDRAAHRTRPGCPGPRPAA